MRDTDAVRFAGTHPAASSGPSLLSGVRVSIGIGGTGIARHSFCFTLVAYRVSTITHDRTFLHFRMTAYLYFLHRRPLTRESLKI